MAIRDDGYQPQSTVTPGSATTQLDLVGKFRPDDEPITVPEFPETVVLEETTEEIVIEIDLPEPFLIPLTTILYSKPSTDVYLKGS